MDLTTSTDTFGPAEVAGSSTPAWVPRTSPQRNGRGGRLRLAAERARRLTVLRVWFPVLPFIGYWLGTFALYEIGPIVNPPLRWQTYLYLGVCLTAFSGAYALGTRRLSAVTVLPRNQGTLAYRWLSWAAPLAFVGTAGLVVDRLLIGAGSFSRTLNDTEFVREELTGNTSLLTTASVAPYSFALVALSAYFYCASQRQKITLLLHVLMIGQLVLAAANAFLSVNRGVFFWLLTYWAFFIFFVRGDSPTSLLFSRRYRWRRFALLAVAIVVLSYSVFIARYRNSEIYLRGLALEASQNSRYDFLPLDSPDLGALVSLVVYGTHQFVFVDTFLERAEPVAVHPGFLVGGRVIDQVRRFDPSFETQGERTAHQWIAEAGLPQFAWPSVFGWLLPMFGYVGSPVFLAAVGYLYGRVVRQYLKDGGFGQIVVILCIYAALNMSFNWIGGDLSHNMGYVVGGWLMLTGGSARSGKRANGSVERGNGAVGARL